MRTKTSGADDEPEPQLWLFDMVRGGDAGKSPTGRRASASSIGLPTANDSSSPRATRPRRNATTSRTSGTAVPSKPSDCNIGSTGRDFLDDVTTYLFVVDVETRETRRLDDAYGGGAYEPSMGLQPAWGADRITFLSNRTDRPDDSSVMDVCAVAPDRGFAESHRLDPRRAVPRGPRTGPVSRSPRTTRRTHIPTQLYVAEDGDYRTVSDSLDRTVARSGRFRSEDDETLLVAVGDEGGARLVRCLVDEDSPAFTFDSPGNYRDRPDLRLREARRSRSS